uniref:Uncharacterized protein n=1 Tax=Panagrolaimus sp. ES5 TaxID=591445 RepID=A0AC34FG61_9BILA
MTMNNNDHVIFNGEHHPYLTSSSQDLDLQKIANVLRNCEENCCVIKLWIPKLVVRSYGKERRFFCPPPIISLSGNGWAFNKTQLIYNLSNYREELQNKLWNATPQTSATDSEIKRIKTLFNKIPDLPLAMVLKVGINNGTTPFCAAVEDSKNSKMIKTLFISSTDRRQYFKLSCEITQYLGPSTLFPARIIGNFESSEIRVISKPAKRQSARTSDAAYVNLKSGMQVALFCRKKTSSVPIRYLYAEEPIIIPSTDRWSSFYIYAVDTDENADLEKAFVIRQGFIYYNHVVRIVDAVTGVSTPNLILRKVEKNVVQISVQTNEPVAMLQRVAFQFCDTASSYFAISGNSIIQQNTHVISSEAHEAEDCIAWTITNSEYIEFKYFETMGPTVEQITPFPFIKSAQLEGIHENNNTVIEFYGINLGRHLSVYFGLVSSEIISVNCSYIRCFVPSLADVGQYSQMGIHKTSKNQSYQVPISLIRNDGVVYPTDIEFEYSTYSAGKIGKIVNKNPLKFTGNNEEEENEPPSQFEEEPLTNNEESEEDEEEV